METSPRKIIHVDMDAFYAAVEQRDRPELRGLPVIVGGPPQSRGVVCTASYEARVFGVHSAMPSSQAFRLCPDGIFLSPDFSRYSEVSRQIREVFRSATDLVEPLSLDEAFLDVTENKFGLDSATEVAREIRRRIQTRTHLTASAGVAPNKFLAKVASDMNKPDGLTVITPREVRGFVKNLAVRKVPGVGPATEKRCADHRILTCGDFLRFSLTELSEIFGKAGLFFHELARGRDTRPVVADGVRKSCGIEDTFPRDLTKREEAEAEIERLCAALETRLARGDIRGRTVTLKVKYADFQTITRSRTLLHPIHLAADILPCALELLDDTKVGVRPVRLLGVTLSTLVGESPEEQLFLPFD